MKKRLRLFTVALIVFSLMLSSGITAFAQDGAEDSVFKEDSAVLEQKELLSEEELTLDDFPEMHSIDEAGDYMRDKMVARVEVVRFRVDNGFYDGIVEDMLYRAVTSCFTEDTGDYLNLHCYKCLYKHGSDSDNTVTLFEMTFSYLSTYEQEQEVDKEISRILNKLNVNDKDDYTKIKAVHDYMKANIKYDESRSKLSAYNAAVDKEAAYSGFSGLTYRMLKRLDVNVRVIFGKSNGEENIWNIVKIGKKWYNLDNALDAKTASDNSFLKSNADFPDHVREDESSTIEFNSQYPMADKSFKYNPDDFNDWHNHWGASYIREAMNKGWVSRANIFRPEDPVTRAEFVKIVNKAFGYTEKADNVFDDVEEKAWYYDEVRAAIKAGYISTAFSYFRPNEHITRQEAAAIVTTIMNNKDDELDKIKNYSDYTDISEWALTSVEGSIEAGYMGVGVKEFCPCAYITRAETLATISRVK